MKRIVIIIAALGTFIVVFGQLPQKTQKQKGNASDTTKKTSVVFVPVMLGNSDYSGGTITKSDFDKYASQGVKVAGDSGKVLGFQFSYKERKVYEDSIGNLMLLTDLLSEYCIGDTFSPGVSSSIYFRTKHGDTAYFDYIKIQMKNGNHRYGKDMKFIIQ